MVKLMEQFIDVFAHVLPPLFKNKMLEIVPDALKENAWMEHPLLSNLQKRVDTIAKGHQEIISVVNLNPEDYVGPAESLNLCRQANTELKSIVSQYQEYFPQAVAMIPMNNIDGACQIIEEDVAKDSTFAGIQLFTRALGHSITNPAYQPIFELMNQINKPIWLHPVFDKRKPDNNVTFSWEYELTIAMNSIVQAQYFEQYPNLKIIVHHAGAMVPFFAERIRYTQNEQNYQDFKKFFVDTALLGNPKALELTVDFFGIDHVLFGTDAPLGIPPIGATKTIEDALTQTNLKENDLEKIFHQNWKQMQKGITNE
ncbi:amidohydrolase family protein [Xylocopilactobacillus apis]|uniref:4-oxalomesaconate hydratase n=1 Tax=Xylocopilactobacillus apis TaxID=2932183 RepID=A0AAU9DF22_9LACO|nr:amidohydrolase family protein [Xylocopilactobacillus apis]BDR56821.1 4-oxalomesaconate hydratase [Xylocopilactobacillus apis]